MKKILLSILIFSLSFIFGCGRTGLISGIPSKIVIEPNTATVAIQTSNQFVAKGYDEHDKEIHFVPVSWVVKPYEFGDIEGGGRTDDDRPYVIFKATGLGTGTLECVYSDVRGSATITSVGTIEIITVTPNPKIVQKGSTQTFTATAEDNSGNIITLITPTWEVKGGIGTIESTWNNYASFKATAAGFGTIEAHFYGKVGSAEITVSGEVQEVSAAATKSVYVDSSNTSWNSSGEASLKVGFETSTPSTTETYLYFDISALGIPSTATINWVKIVLKVQAPKPSGLSVSIHKVTTSWAETGGSKVSWSNKPSFDLTSLDDKNVDSDTTQIEFTSTELKDLISGVVDGTITNYEGFYIKRTSFTSMGEAIFYSRWAASHNQPKIYINYSE